MIEQTNKPSGQLKESAATNSPITSAMQTQVFWLQELAVALKNLENVLASVLSEPAVTTSEDTPAPGSAALTTTIHDNNRSLSGITGYVRNMTERIEL